MNGDSEQARKIRELAEHFRAFGCDDPESWARSEIREGINQYARFVFLHEAWRTAVIGDGATSWIDEEIEISERPPYVARTFGTALQARLLTAIHYARTNLRRVLDDKPLMEVSDLDAALCCSKSAESCDLSIGRRASP